jgi:hypothetical protein
MGVSSATGTTTTAAGAAHCGCTSSSARDDDEEMAAAGSLLSSQQDVASSSGSTPSSSSSCRVTTTKQEDDNEEDGEVVVAGTAAPAEVLPQQEAELLIDNSTTVYIPIQHLPCGVRLFCQPDVLEACPNIVSVLDSDVRQCQAVLPASVRGRIRRTVTIWINSGNYRIGRARAPQICNHTAVHHHPAWLVW